MQQEGKHASSQPPHALVSLGNASVADHAALNVFVNAAQTESRVAFEIDRIPILAPCIVHRQAPLQNLRSLFLKTGQNVDPPIVAIVGNAADGKTELAKDYAHHFKEQYAHRWFVPVENWQESYRKLAKERRLFSDSEIDSLDIEFIVHAVHVEFSQQSENKRSLIIFDDASPTFIAQKLKKDLPSNTDILVTSKESDWPVKLSLSEDRHQLTLEEGKQILHSWIGEKRFDPDKAEEIVNRFSHLPVVIAQAGHYISKRETMAMDEFLPLFDSKKREILSKGKHADQNIDIVVALDFTRSQLSTQALELLLYSAFLPGKDIPLVFLGELLGVDRESLKDLISNLGTLVIGDIHSVTIHRVIQDIVVGDCAFKEKYLSKIATVSKKYPEFLMTDVLRAVSIYEQGVKDTKNKDADFALFSERLGDAYELSGKYQEALEQHRTALQTRLEVLGNQDLDTATSYAHVGLSLRELDRNEEALEYLQKALTIRKLLLKENHPDVAHSYGYVGMCLRTLGRHREALNHKQQALNIVCEVNGENHPNTGRIYNNIGSSFRDVGDFQKAFECRKKAFHILTNTLGEGHIDTAQTLVNLGWSLMDLGWYEQALETQKRALSILKKLLGEEHPVTAWCHYHISETLINLREYKEAIKHIETALRIYRNTLTEEHRDVARCYDSLNVCLRNTGHYQEAFNKGQKALTIKKRKLGEEHPDTAVSYRCVGVALCRLGFFSEGLEYQERGLEILEKTLGERHPDTAKSYQRLGSTLDELGQYDKALMYKLKALQVRQEKLGDHPITVTSLLAVGQSLRYLERAEEALKYEHEAEAMRKRLSQNVLHHFLLRSSSKHNASLNGYVLANTASTVDCER